MALTLRNARAWEDGDTRLADVSIEGERVGAVAPAGDGPRGPRGGREVDLEGRVLLAGLVNAHDHLDFSTFPPLGDPPYASVYEWAAAVGGRTSSAPLGAALAVPLADRLFLGGLRNLLAGVTAVAHHNPYHRSLGRRDFPLRVLAKYAFAHSPGLTPHLRRTYRTSDRRIPWMVHAGEGTDARCRGELAALVEANVLRQNTVIIHGIALPPEEAPLLAAAGACVVWCPESNRRLYKATAPVAAFRAAGVRIGLGSDSPVSGVRDPLSNLAAARKEGAFSDGALLTLATRGSAEVARLPVGAFAAGARADFVAVSSLERFLGGDRTTVDLVVVAGRPVYGGRGLLEAAGTRAEGLAVDGEGRWIEERVGRRVSKILRAHPSLRRVPWIAGLSFD